jgi:hypothetical protein
MASESNVQRLVWVGVANTTILFRVNTGRAWLSGMGPPGVRKLTDGSVHIHAARPIALGFSRTNGEPVKGTSDLIGWTAVDVTPEMVGCRVAIYTAIETKKSKGGHTSDDQQNFIDQVIKAGGIAGVANSPEAARQIVADYRPQKVNFQQK